MIDYSKDVLFLQDYLFNGTVIEYDIQAAGYNILIENNALTEQQIQDLGNMTKNSRNISIGLMIRDDHHLQEILSQGYANARKSFIEGNHLEEADIICIKKDAIFTTRRCSVLQFGGIKFRPKTKWRSYLMLGRIEFLFLDKDRFQVNYLGTSAIEYHRDGWIKAILEIMSRLSNADKSVRSYVMNIIKRYKEGTLDERFYHPLKSDPSQRDDLYNYQNVIVPLMIILSKVI